MKPSRIVRLVVILAVGVGLYWYQHRAQEAPAGTASHEATFQTGGRVVATIRTEPKTFNRLVAASATESRISQLTQSSLVRLNLATGQLEPRLAREWSSSADGLTWTFKLREASYSDGVPFTSADVVFTFDVLYDKKVASSMATDFFIDGKPLTVRAVDEHTVTIAFPAPYGPGVALFDVLPMLPKHSLEAAFKAGKFAEAWGVGSKLADIPGTGPFVLSAFVPGQSVTLAKNPKFWRSDDAGRPLPYIDELQLLVVPEQNAEVLRLESGDVDLAGDFIRPEDYAALKQLEEKGKLTLADAGVEIAPSALWFNLTPTKAAKDGARPWLHREELRRAISYGVDRQALVNSVYLGAAVPIYGPITPGHGEWYLPDLAKTEFDATKAKQLLATIGLQDRNGDGLAEDAAGKPAKFTLFTQKGNTTRESISAVLKDQLRKIGLDVDVVQEDAHALRDRIGKGDYDAMFYGVDLGLTDPALSGMEMWLSSGHFHFWNPQQTTPETQWEAQIDDVMRKQARTIDRKERLALFATAQRTLAEHLPILYFAAQKATVAIGARLHGATPVVIKPPVLWNAEMIWVGAGR